MGATEDQALTIKRRSLKRWGIWRTQPLINISIWIRNDVVTNEEDDEVEGWKKESTHKTNKYKYSIVISWYSFVMHLFIFSWCIMHDRMSALMTIYY